MKNQIEIIPIGSHVKKAVALLSGGLDSVLAIYLIKRLGIEVTALHFTSLFSSVSPEEKNSIVHQAVRQLGVQLITQPKGADFLELVRNPQHGYGKNLNPCIDCRIYTLRKAKALMNEIGASFIVTGEVVGQRPMSQRRHTMRMIEKRADCDGLVVRPLSGAILAQTKAEETGLIQRSDLLNIAGRGRKVQIALAKEFGLTAFSQPAGGCLLTDETFSRRLRDLLAQTQDVSREDLELLHVGRHMRLRPGLKVIVGRNQQDNEKIEKITSGYHFSPMDFPGPHVLAIGAPEEDEFTVIASILRRYSKESIRKRAVIVESSTGERRIETDAVANDDWIADRMI